VLESWFEMLKILNMGGGIFQIELCTPKLSGEVFWHLSNVSGFIAWSRRSRDVNETLKLKPKKEHGALVCSACAAFSPVVTRWSLGLGSLKS
jgi:hypothetical protein